MLRSRFSQSRSFKNLSGFSFILQKWHFHPFLSTELTNKLPHGTDLIWLLLPGSVMKNFITVCHQWDHLLKPKICSWCLFHSISTFYNSHMFSLHTLASFRRTSSRTNLFLFTSPYFFVFFFPSGVVLLFSRWVSELISCWSTLIKSEFPTSDSTMWILHLLNRLPPNCLPCLGACEDDLRPVGRTPTLESQTHLFVTGANIPLIPVCRRAWVQFLVESIQTYAPARSDFLENKRSNRQVFVFSLEHFISKSILLTIAVHRSRKTGPTRHHCNITFLNPNCFFASVYSFIVDLVLFKPNSFKV